MSLGTIESRFKWIFGTNEASSGGGALQGNNVLGATGAGVAFNMHALGERLTFYVETDAAATCAYQLRTGRTSSGPWAVISSGTLSTGAVDYVTTPGPLNWLSPRLKTLNSTANTVIIRMVAN